MESPGITHPDYAPFPLWFQYLSANNISLHQPALKTKKIIIKKKDFNKHAYCGPQEERLYWC